MRPVDRVLTLNRQGWDRRVEEQDVWTRPVSPDAIACARQGDWAIVLTPNRPVPRAWFGDVADRDVLCLASGGGQQGPILAAAGARVSVFDASARQLAQDEMVALRDNLALTTTQGFMHDLACFADVSFDMIFHPASNCYAPDIEPVWRECHRVLRRGGALLSGFMNPDVYIFDAEAEERGELVVRHALPYREIDDLPSEELERRVRQNHTVEFSHSLETQIGGQLKAGFVLTDMFEDKDHGLPATGVSRFMPTLFATRAVKP
ncbi:class I SAM-dependent methyltransferase [Lichenicoccus sp.]|uniref:class I SAM-dependent methyltransferase n=1 Tax=Lichenicoccus sp. TaxID=2781899 RepID=UPI003D12D176